VKQSAVTQRTTLADFTLLVNLHHHYLSLYAIIESLDPICRDSMDMQYV